MNTFNSVEGAIWRPYALWLTIELSLWSMSCQSQRYAGDFYLSYPLWLSSGC